MSTQRYISTSFWDDGWIQTLDPSEKLLYLYLMTNPLTNIAGVYKITIRRMCFDTGFNADTVGHILGKFEKAKKAYLHGEYIILPSWPQHQKAEDRSKIKKGIDAIIKSLPVNLVEYMVSIGYRYHIEGYTYRSNYSDSDSDLDPDCDSTPPPYEEEPKPDKKTKPEKPLNPEAVRLSELLLELHRKIDPKYLKDPEKAKSATVRWSKDIDLLIRKDERSPEEVERVLRWAKADSFWSSNILSGDSLREKFPKLIARMKQPSNGEQSPLKVHTRTTMLDMPEA